MVETIITDVITLPLWGIAISVLIFCGLHYLSKGLKNENIKDKAIMFGFACFFYGIAAARLLFYLNIYNIHGEFVNYVFIGDYSDVGPMYKYISLGAYICSLCGFTLFFFSIEFVFKKTKYIITILNTFILIIILFLPYDLTRMIVYFAFFSNSSIFLIMCLFLAKKSKTELKSVSILILIGFGLIGVGQILDMSFFKTLSIFPLFIPPCLFIIGALIAVAPTILDPKYLSSAIIYWIIAEVFFISLFIIGLYIILTFDLPFGYALPVLIIVLLFAVGIIFSLQRLFRLIKPIKTIAKKEDKVDVLGIFIKPQRVTEEEVSVSKEKKICLVCKGKVGGIMFMCTDCGAFYCQKCSEALSNLENACWACETTIDESKPVKITERKEEKVEIKDKYK